MNMKCFAKRGTIATGVLFLCVAAGLAGDQTTPPVGAPTPLTVPPAARPRKNNAPPDFFAGLTLTDDQKAKIEKIRENEKSREEAVAKDTKLSPDVKEAMLDGYRRIENKEMFEVLTPEQQQEVRKRISEWRASQPGRRQYPQRSQMTPRASQQPAPAPPAK